MKMGIFNMMAIADSEKKVDSEKTINADVVDDKTVVITDNEDKKIKIEGTLSEIYTKALDEAYAVENMGSIINLRRKMMNDSEVSGFNKNDLYIHIPDQKDIEENDINEVAGRLRIALDKEDSKRKMVVIEDMKGENRVNLLRDYLIKYGVECVSSKSLAVEVMRSMIKV